MLKINSMNYNASADSVDGQDEVLASMSFSADNYSNYYFNLNFHDLEKITNATVTSDFNEFKAMAASVVAAGDEADDT